MSPEMAAALDRSSTQIATNVQATPLGAAAIEQAPAPVETPAQPVVEPVATPTETTAAPVTTTAPTSTEAAAEEAPSAFDLIATPTTNEPSAETKNTDAVDYKAKYEEVSNILSDPEMAELIRIKKAGGSLVDFAKQYTPVDYAKLTTEDLIRRYGADNNWSQEQIDGDIEVLGAKSNFEQQAIRRALEAELSQKQQDKFKTLVADVVKPLEQNEMLVNKSIDKINALSNTMVGRDMYGVMKLTDKHAESFREFSMNPPTTLSDGTVNENFLYAAWLGMVAFPELHKTLKSENKTLGMKEVLKEIQRASVNSTAIATTMPADSQQQSPKPANAGELSSAFHNRRA